MSQTPRKKTFHTSFHTKLASTIMALSVMALALSIKAQAPEPIPQVNLNTATVTELAHLPGVGPITAQRIIEYRNKRPFRRISDIIRVKGIGRKTYRKLRPYLCVTGPTTAKQKIKIQK